MKKLFFLMLLASLNAVCQDRNSVWVFGDSAGIDFSNVTNPVPIISGMDGRGSCASLSDSIGNLILYSSVQGNVNNDWATRIFNNQNQIVLGCDSITGEAWYNENLIIQRPSHTNQFYVFTVGLDAPNNQGLFYSLVDMNLNAGLGGMLSQNIRRNSAKSGDCLTAVQHGNGRDWWIINKYSNTNGTMHNRFYIYLVNSNSVSVATSQNFNDATDVDFQKLIWNSTSDKFMLINTMGYMSEFNFDRCTGIISLIRNIFPEQSGFYDRRFWEGAYSSNDSVFYVSTSGVFISDTTYIWQYDLYAANIPASRVVLDTFNYPITLGAVRLAPNGKIYVTCGYGDISGIPGYPYPDSVRNVYNENLGVINYPDSLGVSCDYNPFSFYLGGKRTYLGLPNNPNYELGRLVGSPCDTLTVITELGGNEKSPLLHLAPNPVTRTLYFNAERVMGKNAVISISNSLGQIVYENASEVFNGGYVTQTINVSGFSKGVYFITLQTEKENVTEKFVKE